MEKNDFNEKYYKKVARYALFQIIVKIERYLLYLELNSLSRLLCP